MTSATTHAISSIANASRLTRPGARFHHATLDRLPVRRLFAERRFTRELLERFGFFLIDDYLLDPVESGEERVGPEPVGPNVPYILQWLHQDGPNLEVMPDLMSLRYVGSGPRGYATFITEDSDALFHACLSFLATTEIAGPSEAVRAMCDDARRRLEDVAAGTVGAYQSYTDPKRGCSVDLRVFLFRGAAPFLLNQGFLPRLYETLEQQGLAYRHEWKPNQLLVLLNSHGMLHGRGPSRLPASERRGPYAHVFRQWLQWTDDAVEAFQVK